MDLHHFINIFLQGSKVYGPYAAIGISVIFIIWRKRTWLCNVIKTIKGISYVKESVDTSITGALSSILFKLNADRAFVFEYSGYDERIQPIPFSYADNTFEVLNPAVQVGAQKHNLQGIPLSSIQIWSKGFSTNGEVCIPDIEDIRQTDPTTYKILEQQCIKSCYAINLVDFRGVALGFVGVDYCQDNTELSKSDFKSLRYEALKITGLLIIRRNGSLKKAQSAQKETNKQKFLPFNYKG